jgi:hypothetical protein
MKRILALMLVALLGLTFPAAAKDDASPTAEMSCSLENGSMICAVHATSEAGRLYAVVILEMDPARLLSLRVLKLFKGFMARLGIDGSVLRTTL